MKLAALERKRAVDHPIDSSVLDPIAPENFAIDAHVLATSSWKTMGPSGVIAA